MPVTFDLYTEPYGSTGNIGQNFLRLLGAPALDPLQTVIREAVQNIADAAKLGKGPEIMIRLRRLDPDQRACMREHVLARLPEEESSRKSLSRFLRSEKAVVLEICDFGTTGLGGPTRADRIPVGTKRTDFINFLRNIGTPRDTEHGGGTYGFGKAALYATSRCHTLLVDTLVADQDDGTRRLIACHVGARFETPEDGMRRQFTGRHWWGVTDPQDGIADPATGAAASELAAAIGMPERPKGRTGTSIMILDFDVDGEDLANVGRRIVEGLLWSFWPRMMRSTRKAKRFSCTVEVEGDPLEIPEPEAFPPLDLFCKAMQVARSGKGNDVRLIRSERPARELGTLAIERGLHGRRTRLVDEADSLFPTTAHHIALMRPVELVVKYLEGQPLPDERLEWAGVFMTSSDDDIERAFALSEPPAHDDWVPGTLEGHAKRFVNIALKRLRGHAAEMGSVAAGTAAQDGDTPPLARVSGLLGAALEGVTGEGAGPSRGTGSGSSRRPVRARASAPVFERLAREQGRTVAIFSTEVRQDDIRSGMALKASAAVALDGAATRQIEGSLVGPEVLAIGVMADGDRQPGSVMDLGGAEGRYEIIVSVPAECAVTVDAEVLAGDGA